MLRRPEYRRTLVLSAVIGIPVSFSAFWFLVALHELERLLWQVLPGLFGLQAPPWWWPLPLLALAGVIVGLVVTHLPGRGGHVPAGGLHTGGTTTSALPGVILAAMAGLPLGAVLGPEAPLIAFGGGLALLLRDLVRSPATDRDNALVGAAGSAAAIATIFGNPVVAAVLLMEVAGVGGPQLFAVMLPALLASGVGDIVFTGFGRWTGLRTTRLDIGLPRPSTLDAGDVVWGVLLALAVAVAVHLTLTGGKVAAVFVSRRPLPYTVLCALAAGVCAAGYALATGRSPQDVASSGQTALARMAADPHLWPAAALVAVLLCKGAAYALCLGSLRGGPIFPALFLGGAAGLLAAPLPGFGVVPAMATGMAAGAAAAMRLPVSSVVLVVLLLGNTDSVPVVVLAVVVSFVVAELLRQGPDIPPLPPLRGGRPPAPGGAPRAASQPP
ncbi:chloride channel protein [Streptomyces sp. ME03-5709C]|nr:chloride channel protein [Streptomyces sp. ME03-5709C]